YMQAQHVDVDDDWNYVHNLMYAIANLLEAGEFKNATELSGKLKGARGKMDATLYIGSARDAISRIDPALPVALRAADWATTLALLKSANPTLPNLKFLASQLTLFAQGMQALDHHDISAAEAVSQQFDAELWRMSDHAKDEANIKEKEKKAEQNA